MASAQQRPEQILEFPAEKLEHMNGLSMDFGASVMKIAYLSKEDWKDRKPDSKEAGKVRLTSFSRETFEKGIEFLKENCFIKRKTEDDKPLMYTTGTGGNQFGKKFEEALNIRTENGNELVCFQATLEYFVENMPLDEYCLPIPKEATENAKKVTSTTDELVVDLNKKGLANFYSKENFRELVKKDYNPSDNIKPYLMAVFGSAWGVMQFMEDGSQSLVNGSPLAGRSFLGLGRILTGAKTYEELMNLAEKGDNLKIDMTTRDAAEKSEDSKEEYDVYSAMRKMQPRPNFLWGLGVTKDPSEFKKEDLARSLLYSMCTVLVATAFDACIMTRTKHIFIGGGFASHPLVARIVMEEFEFRKWQATSTFRDCDGDCHLHILKYGSHLGALGTFLDQCNKKKPGVENV